MAQEGRIRVGICSWTDSTLLKSEFYPRGLSTPASRLAFYATQFDTVEVDSSFYAVPDPGIAFRWVAGTPKNFLFGIKSFSLFTFHRAKFPSLPRWLRDELSGGGGENSFVKRDDLSPVQRRRLFDDFMDSVRIIHEAGRLAYILFQFPPYWRFSRENLLYLRRLREVCGPLPIAIEIRNGVWFAPGNEEKFLSVLTEENLAYVAVDEPNVAWTAGREWPLTAEWGTIARFHGRNEASWRKPGASVHERFDYEYRRDELDEWVRKIQERGKAKRIFLMYNNCVGDKAVKSARLMSEMLDISPPISGGQKNIF
ncbi:MAG: DUF72 domain-containing protein [Synergistaceae bacterium]|nr:DUF72 domain-containing protein [Synergistaceae bacterium]